MSQRLLLLLFVVHTTFCVNAKNITQYKVPNRIKIPYLDLALGMKFKDVKSMFLFSDSIDAYIHEYNNITIYLWKNWRNVKKLEYEILFDLSNYNDISIYSQDFIKLYGVSYHEKKIGVLRDTNVEIKELTWVFDNYSVIVTYTPAEEIKKNLSELESKAINQYYFSAVYTVP